MRKRGTRRPRRDEKQWAEIFRRFELGELVLRMARRAPIADPSQPHPIPVQGNAFCLRVDDNIGGCVVIKRDKNGTRLDYPVAGALEPLIERRIAAAESPSSYLFPGPNGGNAHSSIRRWLPKVVRAAGLVWGKYVKGEDGKPIRDEDGHKVLDPDGCIFHTFRHTSASLAAASGLSDAEIQLSGNWKDLKMVQRYRHYADEKRHEIAAKVADAIVGRGHTVVTIAESTKT